MSYLIRESFKYIFYMYLVSVGVFFNTVSASEEKQHSITVQFAPGEVFQLISPISQPESELLRRAYYQTALPLAQTYGFENLGQLSVKNTLVGDFKPPIFVIGGWPSLHAQKAFQSHDSWSDIKAARIEAWDELLLYNSVVERPTTLTFNKDKAYTIAVAWTKASSPNSYFEYLEAVEPLLTKIGARFMYKLKLPTLDAHTPNAHAPQQITFVEWQSAGDLQKLQSLPEYQEIYPLFQAGIEKFEFHQVVPRIQ